jgi:hypothetical protein
MPPSKVSLNRSYDSSHIDSFDCSSSENLPWSSSRSKRQASVSVTTVLMIALFIFFGFTAVAQFEKYFY